MSHRQRNSKRNQHHVGYWWCGDNEDTTWRSFPTKEDAWAYVLGKIRKTIKAFAEEGETKIDFEKVKDKLLDKGLVQVEYAGNDCRRHTFIYDKYKKRW